MPKHNTNQSLKTFFHFCLSNEKDDKEGGFGLGSRKFNLQFHEHHLLFDDKMQVTSKRSEIERKHERNSELMNRMIAMVDLGLAIIKSNSTSMNISCCLIRKENVKERKKSVRIYKKNIQVHVCLCNLFHLLSRSPDFYYILSKG